jgi:hypothetical protein
MCAGGPGERRAPGRAVQVDPIKPTLKSPEPPRLKLEFHGLLSSFAFILSLRRYSLVSAAGEVVGVHSFGDAFYGGHRCGHHSATVAPTPSIHMPFHPPHCKPWFHEINAMLC